jgi:hypothetical protein
MGNVGQPISVNVPQSYGNFYAPGQAQNNLSDLPAKVAQGVSNASIKGRFVQPVNVYIDGDVVATAMIDKINKLNLQPA